jgi:UDPglucose--hexose-1-phosphate uridylyltransferase
VSRELRRDPLSGDDVIIATERVVERPPSPEHALGREQCPFCPGHESHTPPTIQAIERDGRWVARAFANRRPALVVEDPFRIDVDGPFQAATGLGAHEVLVECPDHGALHHQPVERTADALDLARRRLHDLRGDRRLRVLQWYRNHGSAAGASQPHPHAQIVGLPVVPGRVGRMATRARDWLDRTGRVLLRDVLEGEVRDGRRILFREGPITALCPFAPRHPYEVWLVPSEVRPGLADATDEEVEGLAVAMRRAVRALALVTADAAYNAVALGAPEGEDPRGIGWHLRLSPRLLTTAGLEDATGVALHAVFPEDAASDLRDALGRDQP